jgi:hypothetical protein
MADEDFPLAAPWEEVENSDEADPRDNRLEVIEEDGERHEDGAQMEVDGNRALDPLFS